MQHTRVYLLGFMGGGKTYTGRRLATRLDYAFTDLDALIVQRERRSIPDIFAQSGEEVFRQIEREALEATQYLEEMVISCGGGTPCFFENMDWINRHGLSVYLHTHPHLLHQRLRRGQDRRPLIKGMNDYQLQEFIAWKVKERTPFYQQAVVEVHQQSDDEDMAALIHQHLLDITGH